ncbi:hypothetical protein [Bacteroides sp. 519]|uniref:hypothetical protein n=1 Tax=Bacteroides sp. 519 TaxID=2302937 RepID=UPI0013D76769|nr:hypothetical protein [Bacteroides sp. 519]
MTVKTIIRNILILLIVVGGLASCSYGDQLEPVKQPDNGSALVKLEVRVPGNATPMSRALQPQHEDEVEGIIVFAFEKGSGTNWDTPLKYIGKSVGAAHGTGLTKQFTVELYSGQWDLWVLANAEDLIYDLQEKHAVDVFSDDFTSLGFTKARLQMDIKKTVTDKWNVDPTDANNAYRMPMWGMLDDIQVLTSSTNIIRTVNLYRMLVKIDVEVQRTADPDAPDIYPGIPMSKFELTHVSLHNYNTVGRLVPGVTAEDGSWTNENGGVALKTSLPTDPGSVYGWQESNRLEWSDLNDFTTQGTALNGTIYTLEADSGTHSGNRPCIIIGGRYNRSNRITYYRADFLDSEKHYLNLLRNHRYKFMIRKIGGEGFSTIEDAYLAGPTDLDAEVIEWNEGGYLEGVWNGTHEIKFSKLTAHFSQFAKPDQQVITLRTNVPTLTFEEFTDFASAAGDKLWQPLNEHSWTNGHFTVQVNKTATLGEYSDYEITITAKPANNGDVARLSTFTVKGYMLHVKITISQDNSIKYRLQTFPDHVFPIAIDGMHQFIKIEVESTHPYKINIDNPMFLNVYDEGAQLIPDYNEISETKKVIYIEIAEHVLPEARVGEFFIRHVSSESEASARIYSVLQLSPILLAELADGGYNAQVQKGGGVKEIIVSSNLAGWKPILTINGVLYQEELSQYFNVVNGVRNQKVVVTIPKMPASETADKIYTITFKDNNSLMQTEHPIVITQKALSTTPPTTGVKAPANILAVNDQGELNLDGDGYIVYFKWGSLIAISGSPEEFNSSQIAWAPEEYDISMINDTWDNIQYPTTAGIPATDLVNGFGDPCTLALKNRVKGGWKMPVGSSWSEQITTDKWGTAYIQNTFTIGISSNVMFYPAAGKRVSGNALYGKDEHGYYLLNSSEQAPIARGISFNSGYYANGMNLGRAVAYPIRCVED